MCNCKVSSLIIDDANMENMVPTWGELEKFNPMDHSVGSESGLCSFWLMQAGHISTRFVNLEGKYKYYWNVI